jgi:hypothetical protein
MADGARAGARTKPTDNVCEGWPKMVHSIDLDEVSASTSTRLVISLPDFAVKFCACHFAPRRASSAAAPCTWRRALPRRIARAVRPSRGRACARPGPITRSCAATHVGGVGDDTEHVDLALVRRLLEVGDGAEVEIVPRDGLVPARLLHFVDGARPCADGSEASRRRHGASHVEARSGI